MIAPSACSLLTSPSPGSSRQRVGIVGLESRHLYHREGVETGSCRLKMRVNVLSGITH